MKLAVIGTGYVGLVTGACLAKLGNEVVCVDKDKKRLSVLAKGEVPFYEPGLADLVAKNYRASRLTFSQDLVRAVRQAEVVFIAVGTPSRKDGQADISAVIEVAEGIAAAMRGKSSFKVIVNKSTVPVGMGDVVTKILRQKGVPAKRFSVVSNPEFLKEGAAIADFMKPDRIVIGASNNSAFNVITELYRPLNAHIVFTTVKSAELIKYASNTFLAMKISFINEIANVCERVGSDVLEVANAMGLDKRIGREFLNAGLGYGGSCFPKDVSALIHLAREQGYEPRLLSAANEVNRSQIGLFFAKVMKQLGTLKGKKIAVLGLSFKPETDDLREAPALKILTALAAQGALVTVYDPAAAEGARRLKLGKVRFAKDAYQALSGAEAMIVATEWAEFRELDFERVKKIMSRPVIFDGRNIYDSKRLKEMGFRYFGVGR